MLPSGSENHLETEIKDQTKCQIEISDTMIIFIAESRARKIASSFLLAMTNLLLESVNGEVKIFQRQRRLMTDS
jgi:hypothetical protein